MFEKFQPDAFHAHLWPPLVVIAGIGLFGLILLMVH